MLRRLEWGIAARYRREPSFKRPQSGQGKGRGSFFLRATDAAAGGDLRCVDLEAMPTIEAMPKSPRPTEGIEISRLHGPAEHAGDGSMNGSTRGLVR